MAQTVHLKYFVWHDWVTSTSGIVLGCVAAIIPWQMEDVVLGAQASSPAPIPKGPLNPLNEEDKWLTYCTTFRSKVRLNRFLKLSQLHTGLIPGGQKAVQ